MNPELGERYLITTDNWFIAPDGEQYRAVFGTVTGVTSDDQTLGIKTNRGSTNWYVVIGNMIVAGCQIHYCIRTDEVSRRPVTREWVDGDTLRAEREPVSRIYCADDS